MNSTNYEDDVKKIEEAEQVEQEATRIDELKQKLYSSVQKTEAVRERGFSTHRIDVGKNWQETEEKQAKIRAAKEEEERRVKLGLANQNYVHHGSTLYGHYSPAEDVLRNKNTITTSFEGKEVKPEPKESIASFLTDKFADKRAAETEKRIAATDVAMRYASSQIEQRSLYPNIASKEEKAAATEVPPVTNNYHPEFSILTVGDNREIQRSVATATTMPVAPIEEKEEVSVERKNRSNFGMFVFVTMFLFFLGALTYTFIYFQKGINVVSSDKVDIVISGPVSVKSGEINDFSIDITNRNAVDLTLSDLVVQYPQGTMSAVDSTVSLTNERIDVGTIRPGETVRRKASAVFFGEENVKKNISYALEFSIPDSSNIFSTTKDIGVVIAGSPVTAKIVNVKEVTNNQDLSFDIEIQSNTEEVVKNIQLQVEYPFGYKLTQSNLEPAFGNNTWNIGELAPLDTKTIRLTGKLIGTSNLEKNFRFILGVADVKSGEMITVLSTQDQKVTIEKPFVTTKLSLDGLVQDFKAVTYEDIIKGDVVFTNNLDVPITDVVVEVSIAGLLINRTTVKPNNGFYRSTDDVMFWDKSQIERLASVDPGENREVSFNMSVIKSKESLIKTLRRTSGSLSVTIKAKRLNEKLVPEEVVSVISQDIRLETDIGFQSIITRTSGPFANTGVFPPQVNKETTYTYTGKITNTANTVKNLVFVAKLPPNVTWKNTYSSTLPAKSVSYSPSKKEIYITLGDIPAGTGIDTPVKEFSFQVGFTPNITQVGQAPILIINPRVSGVDSFTGRVLDRSIDGLTIIPTGDGDNLGDGSVVE